MAQNFSLCKFSHTLSPYLLRSIISEVALMISSHSCDNPKLFSIPHLHPALDINWNFSLYKNNSW